MQSVPARADVPAHVQPVVAPVMPTSTHATDPEHAPAHASAPPVSDPNPYNSPRVDADADADAITGSAACESGAAGTPERDRQPATAGARAAPDHDAPMVAAPASTAANSMALLPADAAALLPLQPPNALPPHAVATTPGGSVLPAAAVDVCSPRLVPHAPVAPPSHGTPTPPTAAAVPKPASPRLAVHTPPPAPLQSPKPAVGARVDVLGHEFHNGHYSGSAKVSAIDAAGQPVLIREGKGRLVYRNGNWYDGEWVGDKAEGRGKFHWKDSGSTYDGEWRDDKKEGEGVYRYHNSTESYAGGWKADRKHGRGVYTYASGSKYVGTFVDGAACGEGKYTFNTGDTYEGEWQRDKPNGKGVFVYSNGDRFEGTFVDDKKTGPGVFREKSGTLHDGEWKEGTKTGMFTVYDAGTGVWYSEEWFDGQLLERKAQPAPRPNTSAHDPAK